MREIGAVIDGKYRIEERLGSGGMGEVYLARHLHLDEQRVIKILRQDLAGNPSAVQRFRQEARIATQIKHPNVAILYDYSQLPDGSFFMVWEYIDGEDVGERLRREGPFPLTMAIELGIQALRGLEAIHSAGVIHRDISPDNLMLTGDAKGRLHVKIIDLGLAKMLTDSPDFEITQAGVFTGKLRYCSPEQAGLPIDGELDRRSDLYSLASVLYEMICGLPPFDSLNSHGFVFQRLEEDPLSLVERNPAVAVPEELDRVVLRGLARERDTRFPDAVSFIRALVGVARSLGSTPAHAAEVPPARRKPAEAASPAPEARRREAPIATPSARQDPRPTKELSKEERVELLARIEAAARRVEESSGLLRRAESALAEGDLAEAGELAARLRAGHPHLPGLKRLEAELEHRAESDARTGKAKQAEEMLERYLRSNQPELARLAMETLLDLYPNHPRRADYEAWVGLLGEEKGQVEAAEELLERGRAALLRGDVDGARAILEQLEREAPSTRFAETMAREIAAAAVGRAASERVEERRRRFDALVAAGDLDGAERELTHLATLDLPRVTVDLARRRLADARRQRELAGRGVEFEKRFRERVREKDWRGARDIALEFGRAVPESPQPAQLFAEVARLEEAHQRQLALAHGARELESYLKQGRVPEAELALRILLQLDPQHPRRASFERRLEDLKR